MNVPAAVIDDGSVRREPEGHPSRALTWSGHGLVVGCELHEALTHIIGENIYLLEVEHKHGRVFVPTRDARRYAGKSTYAVHVEGRRAKLREADGTERVLLDPCTVRFLE